MPDRLVSDLRDNSFHLTTPEDGRNAAARAGILTLPHAIVQTPVFMAVGTQATVKAMSPSDLRDAGYRLILGNTYHLHLRPGIDLIRKAGGLHRFMGWDGALLTDSGGYQVFSLSNLRTISESGVEFRSHIDGSQHLFTPEVVIGIERALGADIIMAFDECAPYPCTTEYAHEAMERTHRWALACLNAHNSFNRLSEYGWRQSLFGIVQGGVHPELRAQSALALTDMDFDGYAIGGLAVGETAAERSQILGLTVPLLTRSKARYLMGVGTPLDILDSVAHGIDMFDCVLPTRNGRNAQVFTFSGPLNLRNACFARDLAPIDPDCTCTVCRVHSRAYIRHLFKASEMLGPRLATYHNLWFYSRLMEQIRTAIIAGEFSAYRRAFEAAYQAAPVEEQEVEGDE